MNKHDRGNGKSVTVGFLPPDIVWHWYEPENYFSISPNPAMYAELAWQHFWDDLKSPEECLDRYYTQRLGSKS